MASCRIGLEGIFFSTDMPVLELPRVGSRCMKKIQQLKCLISPDHEYSKAALTERLLLLSRSPMTTDEWLMILDRIVLCSGLARGYLGRRMWSWAMILQSVHVC